VIGIACAQCGARIVAALWSEHVNERCVRNVWSCDECAYEFETRVYLAAPKLVTDQDEQ
jgi:ribosomal protein L37AE/L43A